MHIVINYPQCIMYCLKIFMFPFLSSPLPYSHFSFPHSPPPPPPPLSSAPPQYSPPPFAVAVQGRPFVLDMGYINSEPPLSYIWMKDGMLFEGEEDRVHIEHDSIIFNEVIPDDYARYDLRARNGVGEGYAFTFLKGIIHTILYCLVLSYTVLYCPIHTLSCCPIHTLSCYTFLHCPIHTLSRCPIHYYTVLYIPSHAVQVLYIPSHAVLYIPTLSYTYPLMLSRSYTYPLTLSYTFLHCLIHTLSCCAILSSPL